MCRQGHVIVRDIFQNAAAKDLRGLIVWIPMMPGDSAEAADAQSQAFLDQRVPQGWDAERRIGDIFAKTLNLTWTAWDVYLLYPPNVRWDNKEPPEPPVWMHQLTSDWGADEKLRLDGDRLEQAVLHSLERVKQ